LRLIAGLSREIRNLTEYKTPKCQIHQNSLLLSRRPIQTQAPIQTPGNVTEAGVITAKVITLQAQKAVDMIEAEDTAAEARNNGF
jgi:hypothetical protein